MPFQSRSQLQACFAKNDPRWNCKDWAHETPNIAQLPDHKPKLKKMADGGVAGTQTQNTQKEGGALTLKAKIKVKAKGNAKVPDAKDLPGLMGAMAGQMKKRKVRFGK